MGRGQDRFDPSTWQCDFFVISGSRENRAIYGQAALFVTFSDQVAHFCRIVRRSGVFFAVLQTHFILQQAKASRATRRAQS
jgi:hypothetical protein